ncbi:hypothetical protein X759_30865 [Mesorhizobium sp. LSHC420B00]|nr:hypothetical protein X759_30865 [Mesorhizobium sp. LSHC420B00]
MTLFPLIWGASIEISANRPPRKFERHGRRPAAVHDENVERAKQTIACSTARAPAPGRTARQEHLSCKPLAIGLLATTPARLILTYIFLAYYQHIWKNLPYRFALLNW